MPQDMFLRESDQAPQAEQVPKNLKNEHGNLRRGRIAILNSRQEIAAAGTVVTFSYQVPSVKIAYVLEITYDIVNSRVLGTAGSGSEIDPAQFVVESFSFQRAGTTESANIILAGSPTIKEFAGSGELPRLLTRIIEMNPHHSFEVKIKNNDASLAATVSLTFWLETSGE